MAIGLNRLVCRAFSAERPESDTTAGFGLFGLDASVLAPLDLEVVSSSHDIARRRDGPQACKAEIEAIASRLKRKIRRRDPEVVDRSKLMTATVDAVKSIERHSMAISAATA